MKIDHIHFYVEDATSSRDWFIKFMGFQALGVGASHHTRTTVVKSGKVCIVLSSPLTTDSPVAEFLHLHPPGVADIAFAVSDLEGTMDRLVEQGAKVLQPVREQYLVGGCLKWGKIAAWGTLTHTLVERQGIHPGLWLPVQADWVGEANEVGYSPTEVSGAIALFTSIDHIVLNVAPGDLGRAVQWYQTVLGFQPQQVFAIETEQSGLCSQVMVHPVTGVQLPINQPTSANSQIQEFLDVNRGSGIQHIALATDNIVAAIAQLRHRGLSFLEVPANYYTQLRQRYPKSDLPIAQWQKIAAQQILADWQEESPQALLLQTFTQPIFKQPTFFFEVIERRSQAQGFGEGNFRALFEAIEREQLKRGSLGIQSG
ncbi:MULTISPECIES: 4-hydroxyphenylpyruvate dioxygenase [unclassified Coleofasciculus]|uniref:4-hydroxyphenylpyruvate dioxygenase n=1 Tax=unclassified Coleofasciculus TaxID=2692782 RepID=UPI00187F79C5|nr:MULTISPECIES: 4-hydroxyphenylpyruvate dioxygenase [unclassified Coleofasciculus]MBE9128435.1 4-hydroxyphenylpyruvate dioxygenase [Coleofasciculus sp. LEGE 07081]MBE9149408.1 4-hydroxyphenylpyruvate dioxygenase [Coleofasciculus sp. LEGE 07092]